MVFRVVEFCGGAASRMLSASMHGIQLSDTPRTTATVSSGFADDDDNEDGPMTPPTSTIDPSIYAYMRLASAFMHELNTPDSARCAVELANAAAGKPVGASVMAVGAVVKEMVVNDPECVAYALGMADVDVDTDSELVKVLNAMLV
ncbi:hypothetical protein DCS_02115 [Drechmeria coniospora]|uniref:Uncharacterized protein n=1 Tax=Drechmeria coniospora TaxID=98403 RepID=A0A151GV36_DRECN|nr:hypothetical protein DCS_02115 [Drechmeria coniospora]KYK60975.1 hypothetical protein DCS_02115 [Drechmeria coniospora]